MIKALKIFVIIPNLNGRGVIDNAIVSLQAQTQPCEIVVVENNSTDDSLTYLQQNFPDVTISPQKKNLGFAGGVNVGIRYAMEQGAEHVALLNNDATVDREWLKTLVEAAEVEPDTGIVTGKILNKAGSQIDSTGEHYSNWGLPYPRGRGEAVSGAYDKDTFVFGASGGASLYRVKMLNQVGLFDEDFFAYYEDVDLSFRAQLAGWKVRYVPEALAYHQIGATSNKIKGFTTYQTLKNLPMLLIKNVPRKYLFKVGWRYTLAHVAFFVSALSRGQVLTALKGDLAGTYMLIKSLEKRRFIQKHTKVSDDYIWHVMTHDLPPNAHRLRKLRRSYWRMIGKKNG